MIRIILEELIKDFSEISLRQILNEASSSCIQTEENAKKNLERKIYCNYWKNDILTAIKGHDFDINPLTNEMLSNWFIRYAHAICEDPTKLERRCLKICNPLPIYAPRRALLQALEIVKPGKKLSHYFNTISKTSYDPQLNSDNFIKRFQFLLEMEDVNNLHEYLPLIRTNVDLLRYNNNVYSAKVNGIRGIVTPYIDEVLVLPKDFDTTNIMECVHILLSVRKKIKLSVETEIKKNYPFLIVKEIYENEVIMELDENAERLKNLKSVILIFRPSRSLECLQYRALELLKENPEMMNFLFPLKMPASFNINKTHKNFQLINENIAANKEQLAAVNKITNGLTSQAPYIIFGPPGTGKTTTIVEAILQLRLQYEQKSRILITAGSNSACDTIAKRILYYFENNPILKKHLENSTVLPFLRIYSGSIIRRVPIPEELQEYSNIKWINGEHAYPAVENIHRYGIVIATLCTVGKLVTGNVSSENFFTHVFIDEAGASSEPETLLGIMGIKNKLNDNCCIILSGDHKQLGPVIKSEKAEKLGLGKSMMQRLLERDCYQVRTTKSYNNTNNDGVITVYNTDLQMRLRKNYRSHPDIVCLYNELYYNYELIAMKSRDKRNWSFLQNTNFPIAFHAVHGEMSQGETKSSCNMLEIKKLLDYVSQLIRVDGVKQEDIAIITPYKLQCDKIKIHLERKNWYQIEVGSVNQFQGREKLIIIASMVRSNQGLGFVRNKQRLNVLLSRAKSLLLILGNPKTLSQSHDIKYVIEKCKRNENYFAETNPKLINDVNVQKPKRARRRRRYNNKKIDNEIIENEKIQTTRRHRRRHRKRNRKSKDAQIQQGTEMISKKLQNLKLDISNAVKSIDFQIKTKEATATKENKDPIQKGIRENINKINQNSTNNSSSRIGILKQSNTR